MTFEEFCRDGLPGLRKFATVLCGSREQADDIVQDVLVRLHSSWWRVDQAANPDAYIRRMVVNEFVSWRRKWSRIVPHSTVPMLTHAADPAGTAADRMLLIDELRRLPRRQRAVLALRYYGGLTDAEIAIELNCAASTVRAHAARALATLRVEIGTPAARFSAEV